MKIKQKAFTLIELLVVIVIIGILATISVATFNGYQQRAREAVVQSDLKPLIDAIYIARTLQEKTLRPYSLTVVEKNASYWLNCAAYVPFLLEGYRGFRRWRI